MGLIEHDPIAQSKEPVAQIVQSSILPECNNCASCYDRDQELKCVKIQITALQNQVFSLNRVVDSLNAVVESLYKVVIPSEDAYLQLILD
jgi:hypothetical protein